MYVVIYVRSTNLSINRIKFTISLFNWSDLSLVNHLNTVYLKYTNKITKVLSGARNSVLWYTICDTRYTIRNWQTINREPRSLKIRKITNCFYLFIYFLMYWFVTRAHMYWGIGGGGLVVGDWWWGIGGGGGMKLGPC